MPLLLGLDAQAASYQPPHPALSLLPWDGQQAELQHARDAIAQVDTLLLGCTHYPYLARVIGEVMGADVVLVSSADETAFGLARLLADTGLARDAADSAPATHRFLSSGDIDWFRALGRRLLGPELTSAESISFDTP